MRHPFRPLALLLLCAPLARAEAPVTSNEDHAQLLASADPQLAAHKRLVYDFWRTVLEGGHLDQARNFLTETYIQHNPNVPTGRAGFVAFFTKISRPVTIEPRIKAHLVAISAEKDLVVLSFAARGSDGPGGKPFTTTWFDMFRIEKGRIAEHWDSSFGGMYE